MKALVTGVAGFVGSNIATRLLASGHSVVGIDSLTDYYDVRLKESNLMRNSTHPNFEFHRGDISEIQLDVIFEDVNSVFHQAGQPGVRKSWGAEFGIYADANIVGTQRLLEAAKESSSLQKFVYASSSSIYGDAESFPTHEGALPKPISPYGVSKLAGEHLVTLYGKNFNVPTVSLRYFTVYGPGQRPDMAFTRFLTSAMKNSQISIFGDGEQVRDFTFIEDVVRANIQVAATETEPGSIFNVAGGSSVSINEVLKTVSNIHGAPLDVKYLPSVSGDVLRTGGSTKTIEKIVGWQSETNLDHGLEQQYAWVEANLDVLSEAISK